MAAAGRTLQPVILSGGAGTRLWPLSRQAMPKQFLALAGGRRSLLQETALRVADKRRFRAPILVGGEEHRFLIRDQLDEIGIEPAALILEPEGRNTAPAVAVAALEAMVHDPEALILVLPSDHAVADLGAFRAAVDTASQAAEAGYLTTFGIEPRHAETGYGYIRAGAALGGVAGARTVDAFVEKPDLARAQAYLAEGGYFWNSGMFLMPAALLLAELERHEPAIAEAARAAHGARRADLGFTRLAAEPFAKAPALALDVAVMERTDRAAVVPADPGWSDLGSFRALRAAGAADARGNVVCGDALLRDTDGTYVHAEGRMLVAGLGLKDMVVVASDDAVLVAPLERAEDVKALVGDLERENRAEGAFHREVHRPWGTYRDIDWETDFRVKRIVVKPGGRLSLQRHAHRSEHWVVVEGVATVTLGDTVTRIARNQSIYVPAGEKHRLENRTDRPLHLIEAQVGDYLGEDDIERFDDVYGR